MVFSPSLANRVRDGLARTHNVFEKKKFGGVGFLLHGNMLVGVWQSSLIVRIGPQAYAAALAEPHVREFDITGKSARSASRALLAKKSSISCYGGDRGV